MSCLTELGAKYGGGRRGGKLASVLCAVRDDRIPETDPPRYIQEGRHSKHRINYFTGLSRLRLPVLGSPRKQ